MKIIVQELVNRPGWVSGNALVFTVKGTGTRTARAFDISASKAPKLTITYNVLTTPTPTSTPTRTPTPASTTTPTAISTLTPTSTAAPTPAGSVRFAVIGDYGKDGVAEDRVAQLVKSWNPAFIITTGDNNYPDGSAATIDQNIGKYYQEFIGNYKGTYGPGSVTNRFWPSLGNHDWYPGNVAPYTDYFTLPNNERYYDVDLGLVHLYAVDSDYREPDGDAHPSSQSNWLQNRLAASMSCFDLVYFHHSPYSSGHHGPTTRMRWPFQTWSADAVLSGHDHTYERLSVNGFPYFINGLGGASKYGFPTRDPNSVVRYNADFGAMLVTASTSGIKYEFYSANNELIDTYQQAKDCATTSIPVLSPTPLALSPTPAASGATTIDNFNDGDLTNWLDRKGSSAATITMAATTDTPDGSAYAADITYLVNGTSTYLYKRLPVSGAAWAADNRTGIRFWFKGDSNNAALSAGTLRIQVREASGDRWNFDLGTHARNGTWQQFTVPFSALYNNGSTGGDGRFTLSDINEINFYLNKSTTDTHISVDQLEAVTQ